MDDMKICLLNESKSFFFLFFHKSVTFFSFISSRKKRQAYFPLYVFEKTRVSCYRLFEENKSIKLQMLALKK